MEDIKIKDDIRYIVATMSDEPMFLIRDYRDIKNLKFMLSNNVSQAIKATDKSTAQDMLHAYKSDSKDDRDFAIMKIRVSYQLVDE